MSISSSRGHFAQQRGHGGGVLLNDDDDDHDGLALHHNNKHHPSQGKLISPVDVHVGLESDHMFSRHALAGLFASSDRRDITSGTGTGTGASRPAHNRQPVVPLLSATATSPPQSDLSPAGMAYAYSDGATSSDTDASHPNSHTSDNEADLGPFTPLTPSNPASSSSSSSRPSRSRVMTTEEPLPSQAQAGPSSAPWRPRELRLVDRQKEGSYDAEQLTAFTRQARAPPSPMVPTTDTWVGLGIQLPKSPGIGLDLPPRSPAPTPGPSRSPGPTVTKKGLKPLALPNGGIASAPLPQLLSPALRDGMWEAGASSPRIRTPTGGGFTGLRGRLPRSREASKESAFGDVRSGARSPLQLLSPSLGYSGETWSSSSTVTSWARESERAAAEAAKLPASVTSASSQSPSSKGKERSIDRSPTKRRRASQRRSRSLSPQRTNDSSQPGFQTADDAPPLSPAYSVAPPSPQQPSSARSSFLSRERPTRSRSTRKKGPPTPLVLLPNGRSASRDSSFSAGGSARSPGSAGSQLTSAGGHDAMPSPRRIIHGGGLLTPALPTGALLSPAFSVYHEALSSPTVPVHDGAAEEETTADAPAQQSMLTLKRASTPLKTARINFDELDDNTTEASVSDYGSDPSFGGSTSAVSPSDDVGMSASVMYAGYVADSIEYSGDFQSSESAVSEWPSTSSSLQVSANKRPAAGDEVRESTPTGAQGGLTASSSATSAFGDLPAIPSASSSMTEMSGIPTPPSIQVSRIQSFSSDRLASDGHGAVSGDSSDSHEAFEFDAAIEDTTASDDIEPLPPAADSRDEEDSTDRHTPRSQTPIAAASISEDAQHSFTLSSADAEGSLDPEFMQEEATEDDESILSHESGLSSAMGFASPPLRIGPLGDLADEEEQHQHQTINTSARIGSDLSIDFEQGKTFSDLLSPDFKTSSLFPTPAEVDMTPKLPSSEAMELPPDVEGGLGLSHDESERSHSDSGAQDTSAASGMVIRFDSPEDSTVALPSLKSMELTGPSPAVEQPIASPSATGLSTSPSFNTTIFKSPAMPRRTQEEDSVGPTDMRSSDSPMGDSVQAGFPRNLSPTNDLYMRSLPERTISPQAPNVPAVVPPPDSASLASRPRLRVNTSSPPPIGDAFKASYTASDANLTNNRQAFVQSPVPASPIRPLYFPEARSAPLLQGAFPSPAFLSSPFSQQGVFAPFNSGGASRDVDDNYGLSSRWSSGSESEEEAPKRNSKSRRSASSKKRSSSAAPSARNSVSNPPPASGSAVQAPITQTPAPLGSRKSLFQSLGLRKKSLPNLSHGNGGGGSSNRSSQSATPASQNSPALPRASQNYTEFPFPGMTAGTSHGDVSPVTSLQSSKPLRSSGLNHIKQRPSMSSQLSAQPSLSHKHSNSSLRTTGSGKRSPSMSEAASPPSSPSKEKSGFNFAIPTPRRRSRASSRASYGHPVPPVPAHVRGQSTSVAAADVNGSDSTAESPAAAQEAAFAKNEGRNSRGWMKNAMRVNGAPVLKSSQQPPASLPTIASMNFPPEQDGQAHSDNAAGGSPEAQRSGTPTSTEETPRVAYMSLPPLEQAPRRGSKPEVARRLHGADSETLSAIGQGLFDGVASPEVERSNPFMHTHQLSTIESCEPVSVESSESVLPVRRRIPRRKAKHLKWRRQRQQQQVVPHYPSMTDVGRLWVSEHPGQVFGGAHGPQLASYSTGRGPQRGAKGPARGRDGEESSSDDYGDSRDDYGRGNAGRTNGQGGGAGGDRGDDRHDDSSDDDGVPVIEDSDDTSSSEESEDDYGDADDSAAVQALGNESESSDDVPLGQQYDRVARVQSRLLAQERAKGGSKSSRSARQPRRDPAAAAKQSSTGDALNPSELTARLTSLQVRRDTRSASPAVAFQDPARASIRRSPELGRSGTTGSQSQASSLARARSLANRVRQKGLTESGDSSVNTASVGSNRGRRSSDAAAKRSQTFNVPPTSTMPVSTQPWTSAAMQSSILASMPPMTNPAVSKAAIVVATQAARDGKIPAAAIPLQAQALALQATQAGVTPGIVSSAPMAGQRTMSSSHNGVANSDNLMSDDRLAPSSGVSRATSTNTARRRPLGVDTRVAPPMSSPMPSSSGSTKSPPRTAALLEDEPLSGNMADKLPSANSNPRRAQQLPSSVRMQQHKVYIVNKQRFAQCEVPLTARARDLVLDTLDRETVQMTPGRGAWVVFEVSPAFGIERPLREYEVVTQVADASPDSTNDYLLLKQTELAPYLSLRAVPSVSPTLAGYVYVRDRKGKWSKRWLELRDHSIYHAKSDKGKDEVFVCHLSSFDVYLADGGVSKAPKAHSFCLRSQDKISMFENKDDYLHYFCLSDPSAHRDWIRAITNARTYILKQEHAALFQLPPPMAPARPSAVVAGLTGSADEPSLVRSSDGTLSRRGTTKRPSADTPMKQHSVDVLPDMTSPMGQQISPLVSSDAFAGPFEKGSLLANEMRRNNSTANGNRPHGASAPWTGPSQPQDLSMHERTRARMEQERARAEVADRQRRLKDEGKPLINLGGVVRRAE